MTEKAYLYGRNPLQEAIHAKKRGQLFAIEKLLLTKSAQDEPAIMSLIQSNEIPYETVTAAEIESMVGRTAVHQGVLAHLDEKALYTPFAEVFSKAKGAHKNSLFVLLDELQDPHNVGAIIRTAVAFGADAVLIPEHDQTQITGTVIKSASGMNFAIPIVRIGNVNTTLEKLKESGFWTYGLTGNGDTKLRTAKFDTRTVLVVGGEAEGIRARTLDLCDFKLSIETDPLCESLNASNAAAVTLYEWRKQN